MVSSLRQTLRAFLNDSENYSAVIAHGASRALLITSIGVGTSFLLHVLLVRLAGPAEYGIYMYVVSWVAILLVPATAGFEFAVTRYLAPYAAAKDWPRYRALIRYSNKSVLITSLSVCLTAGCIVSLLRRQLISEGLFWCFLAGWAVLPFAALSSLRVAALRSLRSIVSANSPESILRPTLLALSVALLASLTSVELTGGQLMTLDLLVHIVVFLVGAHLLRQRTPLEARSGPIAERQKEWKKYALWLAIHVGLIRLMKEVDVVMIGYFMGTTPAGIYAVAGRIALLVTFGLTAISHIGAPIISSLHTQGRRDELQRMLTFAARVNFAFTLPALLFMVLAGRFILSLFSSVAVTGYTSLLLLTAAHAVTSLCGAVALVMNMTGHQRNALKILAGGAIINVILNALLIPKWGLEGAAAAAAVSTTIMNLTSLLYVRIKLGLRTSIF